LPKLIETPWSVQGILKAAAGFPGQEGCVILRLKKAGLRVRHAAVIEELSDEHKLYCVAFAESSVDHPWGRVIFPGDSAFSSANDGPVLVNRRWGECYKTVFVYFLTQWSCVHSWGWISHERAGMPHHTEGHVDGLQNKHIVQNIMVPSVKMPDGFHQDHSSNHRSRVGHKWILLQAKVKLDWPPRASDMNTTESMWTEMEDSAGNQACPPSQK